MPRVSPFTSFVCVGEWALGNCIRSNQYITGIKINETDNKIGLFADNIVIFSSYGEQSLHHLFITISSFRKLSGYKTNESKFDILFLEFLERINPPVERPFKIVRDSFTYSVLELHLKLKF